MTLTDKLQHFILSAHARVNVSTMTYCIYQKNR